MSSANAVKGRVNHPRECCICFEDLSEHVVQTDCDHVFHFQCLNKWLRSNDDEGNTVNSGPSVPGIIEDLTEEDQLAHVIDLSRDAIQPNNKVFPMCKGIIKEETMTHYVDYENKFARMDVSGLSEDQKKAVNKRRRDNQKRAERRKPNKGNGLNNS